MVGIGKIDCIKGAYNIDRAVKAQLLGNMPLSLRLLDKFNKYTGELSNNVINAVGTAFVAPVCIAYNPISKTDEKTKKYTALRQPISAVLTVVTSTGVVIPLNLAIDRLANKGKLGAAYDKSLLQDESYIARQLKKVNPGWTKKQLALEASKIHMEQYQNVVNNMHTNGTLAANKTSLSVKEFKKLLEETVNGLLKDTNEELKRYNETKLDKQIARNKFYKENPDLSRGVVSEIKKYSQEKNASHSEIKNFIGNLYKKHKKANSNKKNQELLDLLYDLKARPKKEILLEKLIDVENKIQAAVQCKDNAAIGRMVRRNLRKNIVEIEKEKEILNTALKQIEKITEKNKIANFKNLHQTFSEIKTKDLMFEIIQKHIDKIKRSVRGYKDGVGLIAALAILPLSCWMLNWTYPRFIDIVFPRLAKSEKGTVDKK